MEILAPQTLEVGVRDVIRTIWLASFGLALLGGLFATKVVSAPISDRTASGRIVPGVAMLGEALTKPDKTQ